MEYKCINELMVAQYDDELLAFVARGIHKGNIQNGASCPAPSWADENEWIKKFYRDDAKYAVIAIAKYVNNQGDA